MHLSLINLPKFEIHRPPMALAILSAMCSTRKVSHSCLDLNLMLYRDAFEYFETIEDFCITGNISEDAKSALIKVIDYYIQKEISENNTTVFCLSLISTWSQNVCEIFCQRIKLMSTATILLGGQGLANQKWVEQLKQSNLIDYYIIGEGEITFDLFLTNNCTEKTPGFNNYNFEQIEDLASTSIIPDYTLLNVEQYPYLLDSPELYITGSRGCVRRCTYCDVGHQWKKYRYRNGAHIATEMIQQYEKHGITNFFFTDSLVNGSMKMLDDLCDTLIAYKNQNPQLTFKWKGQYIFRPKSQIKESHFAKLKAAGADYLIVGLETGSDKVRYDMDKKHTTNDAEYFLEMFKKYGIRCHLLMLTGYVTETITDHNDTMALFKKWQKFVASDTIAGIELGSTLSIIEHSPIRQQVDKYDISMLNDKPYLWFSQSNAELTIGERIRRRIELHKEAMKYLWPITRSAYRLSTIKSHLIEAIDYYKYNTTKTTKTTKIIPIINSSFME